MFGTTKCPLYLTQSYCRARDAGVSLLKMILVLNVKASSRLTGVRRRPRLGIALPSAGLPVARPVRPYEVGAAETVPSVTVLLLAATAPVAVRLRAKALVTRMEAVVSVTRPATPATVPDGVVVALRALVLAPRGGRLLPNAASRPGLAPAFPVLPTVTVPPTRPFPLGVAEIGAGQALGTVRRPCVALVARTLDPPVATSPARETPTATVAAVAMAAPVHGVLVLGVTVPAPTPRTEERTRLVPATSTRVLGPVAAPETRPTRPMVPDATLVVALVTPTETLAGELAGVPSARPPLEKATSPDPTRPRPFRGALASVLLATRRRAMAAGNGQVGRQTAYSTLGCSATRL